MISLLLHKTDWAEIITVENMEMLKKKQKKTFFFLGGGDISQIRHHVKHLLFFDTI